MPKQEEKYIGNPNWVPGNYNAQSLASKFADLQIGESLSQVTEFDLYKESMYQIEKKQTSRRSTVRTAISRVNNDRGLDYQFDVERGQFVTETNKLFFVINVKRIA